MHYISTRGTAPPVDFVTACLAGLAPDGGLYVPARWPQISPARAGESYIEVASRVLSAFAGDALDPATVEALCARAYGTFAHHSVAPLVQAGPNHFILELHHGPTLAFKDVAMQFIAQLYDHALSQQGQRMSVVCATSGDTGGAAAAAFAGASAVDLFILHPHDRVSPVQRLFMTTTGADNIHNFAIDSDFDACQAMVKAMFADRDFAGRVGLSGVNSINWARIAAQSVYYATAQAALGGDRPLRFIVPSGNMGDALAGYVAARCGLLAGFEAVCAVNENRALETLFATGKMSRGASLATPSPAMDITVPSNFERILFEAAGRDGEQVATLYDTYARTGAAEIPASVRGSLGCMGLSARAVSNAATLAEMARYVAETGGLICPHTAVGTCVARHLPDTGAVNVTLSTAHAAKFPETVSEATGQAVALPARCAGLRDREEVFTRFGPDLAAVRDAILAVRTGA